VSSQPIWDFAEKYRSANTWRDMRSTAELCNPATDLRQAADDIFLLRTV
jgi:hypothetical protein